jgi:hypothetical protein
LSAGEWTSSQKQVMAAAVLMRAMRWPNATGFGSTPSAIAASLLTVAADYMLRLSDMAPAGSSLTTSADIPDRLRAHLEEILVDLLATARHRAG